MTVREKREQLIHQADESMTKYPQYKGHFENYIVGVMLRDVKTKMGKAFDKGEIVIFLPKVRYVKNRVGREVPFVTAWSVKHTCDVSIAKSWIRF